MYKREKLLNKLIFYPFIVLAIFDALIYNEFIEIVDSMDDFTGGFIIVHLVCTALLILSSTALIVKFIQSKKNKKREFQTPLSLHEIKEKCRIENYEVFKRGIGTSRVIFESENHDEVVLKRSSIGITIADPLNLNLTLQGKEEGTIIKCRLYGAVRNVISYAFFSLFISIALSLVMNFVTLFFVQSPVSSGDYAEALIVFMGGVCLSFMPTIGTNSSWKVFDVFFEKELLATEIDESGRI